MSLVAVFTALETLINYEHNNTPVENCSMFKQDKYRTTFKFIQFLLTYVGESSVNKKKFQEMYKLRSAIVHKGNMLSSERPFSNYTRDQLGADIQNEINVLQTGRLAISKWLITKGCEIAHGNH
jgi:AAA+ ATPase superfamily predicted ATPase